MLKRIVLSIFMLTSVSISILAQQQDTLVVSRDGTGKYRTTHRSNGGYPRLYGLQRDNLD